MKKLALLLLVPVFSLMADVTGKWSGNGSDGKGEDHSLFFIFKQDGKKLTGSGGPNEDEQHPMDPGTVEGDSVKFKVPAGEVVFAFNLKANGDEINGEVVVTREGGDGGTFKVVLKKVK
jgi:hypothetical protein